MIVERINARWWLRLNGLVRHAMVRNIPGFRTAEDCANRTS